MVSHLFKINFGKCCVLIHVRVVKLRVGFEHFQPRLCGGNELYITKIQSACRSDSVLQTEAGAEKHDLVFSRFGTRENTQHEASSPSGCGNVPEGRGSLAHGVTCRAERAGQSPGPRQGPAMGRPPPQAGGPPGASGRPLQGSCPSRRSPTEKGYNLGMSSLMEAILKNQFRHVSLAVSFTFSGEK